VGIRGDYQALARMKVQIQKLGGRSVQAGLSRVLMAEALELVDEGFATSTAPDGSPWAPLKLRAGQPLRDTRRLQGSFTGVFSARGFRIGTNVMYAPTHQEGRTIRPRRAQMLRWRVGGRSFAAKEVTIPARPMLPTGSKLPPRWKTAFDEAAIEYMRTVMR
jgi:phage gpG-like protein